MPVFLRCLACGATWLSPFVREMYESGEHCLACNGRLELVEDEQLPAPRDPTGGSADP